MTLPHTIQHYLFRPIDNSPLIIFRIAFGLLLAVEGFGAAGTGWVHTAFIEPTYHFPFIPFEWLTPLPGQGMVYYYILLGVLGIMIMLGWYYRIAIIGYAILWSGCYFMQKVSYNNHYYLMLILCWIVATMDLHAYASIDAKKNPALRSLTCPHWYKVLLIGLLCTVFVYASKAKCYPGWYEGDFIRLIFKFKQSLWLIGDILQNPWLQSVVVWGGIIFDLVVIPMLMYRRTRWLAFAAFVGFHLFNSIVFHIGIFPYLMIGSAVLFFTPEVVRQAFFPHKPKPDLTYHHQPLGISQKVGLSLYTLFVVAQLLLPIRHHFIQGEVLWTEEGHRLSWRMMLRARMGNAKFFITDHDTGSSWTESGSKHLTRKQAKRMSSHPDMIWQYAQWLKRKYAHQGMDNISIHVETKVSINGGDYHPIIDPRADLAKEKWNWSRHNQWIIPDPPHWQGPTKYNEHDQTDSKP